MRMNLNLSRSVLFSAFAVFFVCFSVSAWGAGSSLISTDDVGSHGRVLQSAEVATDSGESISPKVSGAASEFFQTQLSRDQAIEMLDAASKSGGVYLSPEQAEQVNSLLKAQ